MLLGQFELLTPEHAQTVLENPPDAECQIEHTGRLLLPDHLLQRLAACQPPFLFRLARGRDSVYLGYPVFRGFRVGRPGAFAVRNCVLVPSWAARQLTLPKGGAAGCGSAGTGNPSTSGIVGVTQETQPPWISLSVEALPTGAFIRLRPLQPDDVFGWTNPAATLNKKLRDFACLSVGSVFSILYLDRTFHFEIKSLKPAPAVSIIDCDMHLEFDFDQTQPDCPADGVEVAAISDSDAVLSSERLRRCGVTGPAQTSPDDLLRDVLARAHAVANASARCWGAGVTLATGQEVAAHPPTQSVLTEASAATVSSEVRPNLAYEWGSLTFLRPAGRSGLPQSSLTAESVTAAASAKNCSSGKGVRLKDNL